MLRWKSRQHVFKGLGFDAFKCGNCTADEEFEDRLRQHIFLHYAAKHWGEHAVTVEREACEQICSFFLEEGLISCAARLLSAASPESERYGENDAGETIELHLAALLGLSHISEIILLCDIHEVAIAVTAKDIFGRTPLYLAVLRGHFEMAKLLLDKGSDIDARGGRFDNALTAASYQGDEQIVKLLIDNGADANACSRNCYHALAAASRRGHERVIKLLLDNGANVNAWDGSLGKALIEASVRGHEQSVRLLLDNGANGDAQSGYYDNALGTAGSSGRVEVVKVLLEAGSDLKSLDFYHGSFLNLLAFRGHADLLRFIYHQYYDTPLLNEPHGRMPLHLAAKAGHFSAFQYLFSSGFDLA